MRLRRALGALVVPALLSTCAPEQPNGLGFPGAAQLGLRVVAPPSLSQFASGLVVEQVKASLLKVFPNESVDTVATETVPFSADANSVDISFSLIISSPETLYVSLDYQTLSGQTLFLASQQVVLLPGANSNPTAILQPFYAGPGSNVASLNLTPFDSSVTAGDSIQLAATALDSAGAPVTSFYVSWQSDDPRVTVNANGLLRSPADLTRLVLVTALTPNGTLAGTPVTVLGPAALAIFPDSVEKLPNGTQPFVVTVGATRVSQFTWSVNGVDGGNPTFGTIDTAGLYTAPATVPNPARFQVCARETQTPTRQGCATVVIQAVPSVGGDLIVINDMNVFDSTAMNPSASPGANTRFVQNLVTFTTTGARNSGRVVYYDRGRNSPCFLNLECGDASQARLDAAIRSAGFTIQKADVYTPLTSIPSNVKVIMLWNPLIAYDVTEVNALKRFAGEGGRIIFIGERLGFYTQAGIDIENLFMASMGAQMTNIGAEWDCNYTNLSAASLRNHPLLTGVTSLTIACASEIQPGPNDFALFFDTTNQHVLAAVAKIDLTPLPVGIRRAPAVRAAPAPPTGGGAGR